MKSFMTYYPIIRIVDYKIACTVKQYFKYFQDGVQRHVALHYRDKN